MSKLSSNVSFCCKFCCKRFTHAVSSKHYLKTVLSVSQVFILPGNHWFRFVFDTILLPFHLTVLPSHLTITNDEKPLAFRLVSLRLIKLVRSQHCSLFNFSLNLTFRHVKRIEIGVELFIWTHFRATVIQRYQKPNSKIMINNKAFEATQSINTPATLFIFQDYTIYRYDLRAFRMLF